MRGIGGFLVSVVDIFNGQFAVRIRHRRSRIEGESGSICARKGRRIKVINSIHVLHIEHRRLFHTILRGIGSLVGGINRFRRAVNNLGVRESRGNGTRLSGSMLLAFQGHIDLVHTGQATVIAAAGEGVVHRHMGGIHTTPVGERVFSVGTIRRRVGEIRQRIIAGRCECQRTLVRILRIGGRRIGRRQRHIRRRSGSLNRHKRSGGGF